MIRFIIFEEDSIYLAELPGKKTFISWVFSLLSLSPATKSVLADQTLIDLLALPVIAKAAKSESASNPIAKYVFAVALFKAISFIFSRFRFDNSLRFLIFSHF